MHKSSTISNLILHLHPARVPRSAIRFKHTFGLGGMAAVLIVLQFFTGFLLRFQYNPTVQDAYNSINDIIGTSVFGQLIRNAHYWSGQILIIVAFLHLSRIVFMSSYYPPRRANWLIGLGLFGVILLSNFTGYLLPWDQLSFWAVTVVSSMLDYLPFIGSWIKFQLLAGNSVGQNTLLNFYNFHTGILPLILVLLMSYHFWKVRKAGGVLIPDDNANYPETVPVIPNLVAKELITGLVLLSFVMLLSLLIDAPLLSKANPAISPNPSKAPWYFLGIQELIVHLHPFFSVFLIPLGLIIGLILLPFSNKRPLKSGTWFTTEQSKQIVKKTLIFSIIFIPSWMILDEFLLNSSQWIPNLPYWFSEGFIPLLLFVIIVYIAGKFMLQNYKLPFNDLILSGFVFIFSSYIIMMLTSLYFRGPGMKLILPF